MDESLSLFEYKKLADGGIEITRCKDKDVVNIYLPYGVKKIGEFAFEHCSELDSISLPSTVKEICDGAFRGCVSLAEVRYDGDDIGWGAVSIGRENQPLSSAFLIYEEEALSKDGGEVREIIDESLPYHNADNTPSGYRQTVSDTYRPSYRSSTPSKPNFLQTIFDCSDGLSIGHRVSAALISAFFLFGAVISAWVMSFGQTTMEFNAPSTNKLLMGLDRNDATEEFRPVEETLEVIDPSDFIMLSPTVGVNKGELVEADKEKTEEGETPKEGEAVTIKPSFSFNSSFVAEEEGKPLGTYLYSDLSSIGSATTITLSNGLIVQLATSTVTVEPAPSSSISNYGITMYNPHTLAYIPASSMISGIGALRKTGKKFFV